MKTFRGLCTFHSETGTEGGYWAFQDNDFISLPEPGFPQGKWSYDGLHILADGDKLIIHDKNNPTDIVWNGTIKLKNYPLFSEAAFNFWIHADQEDVDRETWAKWFLEDFPAELILA